MPFNLALLSSTLVSDLGARIRETARRTACAQTEIATRIVTLIAQTLGPEIALVALYVVEAHALELLAQTGRVVAPATLTVRETDGHRSGTVACVEIQETLAPPGEALFARFASRVSQQRFALLMVAASPVDPRTVSELETLGGSVDVALHRDVDGSIASAYERLLEGEQRTRLALALQERDEARVSVAKLRVAGDAEAVEHAAQLRRRQTAMLNVIEDLRDARTRLEDRVDERTRELQARNEELEQFAYIASHDLQEPLRTVSGYLQLIEQRYAAKLDHDALEFIAFAVEGARRMQALIEALLLYSRVSMRQRMVQQVPLDDVVDEVLRSLAHAVEEAQAVIERGPLPVVPGDRIQIGQLFQNLLANALKFRGDAPARIQIEATTDASTNHVFIRDRGIGFDNKHAERMFAVFRRLQRKYPGTGIGLAICKKIVELHQGTIRASGVPGQGATFEIMLPKEQR